MSTGCARRSSATPKSRTASTRFRGSATASSPPSPPTFPAGDPHRAVRSGDRPANPDTRDLLPQTPGRFAAEVEAVQVEALLAGGGKAIRQHEAHQQTRRLEQPAHHINGADRPA